MIQVGWFCIVAGLAMMAFRIYIASDFANSIIRDAFPGHQRRLGVGNLWQSVAVIAIGIAVLLVSRLTGTTN